MLSAKWQPFCLGHNVLKKYSTTRFKVSLLLIIWPHNSNSTIHQNISYMTRNIRRKLTPHPGTYKSRTSFAQDAWSPWSWRYISPKNRLQRKSISTRKSPQCELSSHPQWCLQISSTKVTEFCFQQINTPMSSIERMLHWSLPCEYKIQSGVGVGIGP